MFCQCCACLYSNDDIEEAIGAKSNDPGVGIALCSSVQPSDPNPYSKDEIRGDGSNRGNQQPVDKPARLRTLPMT